ncbi:MAG: hypothetical protein ACRBK7_09990 [Acidimicrobiales bacterium]
MASVAEDQKRPSILGTVAMLVLAIIAAFLVWNFVTGLIFSVLRLIVILVGFYIVARLAMYLLRKGS